MSSPHGAVVVGVDGSPDGERAVLWGAGEAVSRRLPMHLVHAYAEAPVEVPLAERDVQAHREAAQRLLAQARERANQAGATEVSAEAVDSPPAAALLTATRDARMVVLGSRGHGALAGLVLGSVSQHVSRHATCPVVVAREVADPRARRVVVGLDGSEHSEKAVGFAFEEAARLGHSLVAVHGFRLVSAGAAGALVPLADGVAESVQAGERMLGEMLSGWAERYPDVPVTREVVPLHPTRVLADASEHAALVVVGSRGRGAFADLLLGSVSQSVLHHARCPVAVVR